MHILALDRGSKKCGLAYRTDKAPIVFPLGILQNDNDLIINLSHIIQERAVTHLLIGLPTSTHIAQAIKHLQTAILQTFPELIVAYGDESYTSIQAQETLGSTTHGGEDAVAAMHLLEHFLITKMSTEQTTISGL